MDLCLRSNGTTAQHCIWLMAILSRFASVALNLNNALFAPEKFDIGHK